MEFSNFIKSNYIKAIFAFCTVQLLSACGTYDDDFVGSSDLATGSASVSWTAPDSREDDTPLNFEIGGYRIYYGSAAGDYQREIDVSYDGSIGGGVSVDGLTVGWTYYFVVTTYDTAGRESLYSPEIEILI